MNIKYSICILTLNHLDKTRLCLNSLMKTAFKEPIEIIIVDNGSEDNTKEYLIDFQKEYHNDKINITIVLNNFNRGCVGGRNQAGKLARGEYIVIIDNDVEFIDENWLNELTSYYESQINIGIVGPKLIYPGEEGLIQSAAVGITPQGKVGYIGCGQPKHLELYNKIQEVQAITAACWLLRREYFDLVDGFDEIYHPVNYEDLDFCYKLKEKGKKIHYYPKVEIIHHEHTTTKNTKGLHFFRTTIKNGMVFKSRWSNVYEKEECSIKKENIVWF